MNMNTSQSCSVYRATSPSGKRYYGVSKEIEKRWWKHEWDAKKGVRRPFAQAIRKYGFDAMNLEVLLTEQGEGAHEKCRDAEMLLIELDNAMVPNGYNATAGGDGATGVKVPKAVAQKRVEAAKATRSNWSEEKKAEVKVNRVRGQNKPELAEQRRSRMLAKWADPVEVAKMLDRKSDTSAYEEAAKKRWLTRDKTPIRNLRRQPVVCVETGESFDSIVAARDWLRANGWPKAVHGHIGAVARGKRPKAYGFTWKFLDKELK